MQAKIGQKVRVANTDRLGYIIEMTDDCARVTGLGYFPITKLVVVESIEKITGFFAWYYKKIGRIHTYDFLKIYEKLKNQ